jgi:hypothetical protein
MSVLSGHIVKALVDHSETRKPIRAQIDEAKASGDVDAELQGRQNLKNYYDKFFPLMKDALTAHSGDAKALNESISAYKIMRANGFEDA